MMREVAWFLVALVRAHRHARPRWSSIVAEVHACFVDSIVLVTVLSLFGGLNLVIQSYTAFVRIGGEDLLGMMVAVGGVRELFPVMAAVVCGAKSGAAIAVSLGNMRISEQIEALEMIGVDPLIEVVSPKIIGLICALPLLCVYADAVGLLSAYVASVYQLHLNAGTFAQSCVQQLTIADLFVGEIKCLLMAAVVAAVASFQGYDLAKSEGAQGVGRVANRAIVYGALACFLLNLVVSTVVYG